MLIIFVGFEITIGIIGHLFFLHGVGVCVCHDVRGQGQVEIDEDTNFDFWFVGDHVLGNGQQIVIKLAEQLGVKVFRIHQQKWKSSVSDCFFLGNLPKKVFPI
mmetsp:Transcript_9552/g.14237  ORF Transcript_9552/g.14237 Transcript_9552/m.14237 type:complete len:103 (-) Transcript_9552:239-547(-)